MKDLCFSICQFRTLRNMTWHILHIFSKTCDAKLCVFICSRETFPIEVLKRTHQHTQILHAQVMSETNNSVSSHLHNSSALCDLNMTHQKKEIKPLVLFDTWQHNVNLNASCFVFSLSLYGSPSLWNLRTWNASVANKYRQLMKDTDDLFYHPNFSSHE